jgi:hypothetical protein
MKSSATDAPVAACNLAVVYAWTGQSDLALAVLEKSITRPAGANQPDQPTYGDFRLNPAWDPLRNDPRFEKLVDRLAPFKPRGLGSLLGTRSFGYAQSL